MNLPQIKNYLKGVKLLTWVFASLIIALVLLVVWLYFVPKKPNQPATPDPTKPTTIVYQGKTYGVPAEVLEISPEGLKESIARKDPAKLVQIMSVDQWQRAHLAGSTFFTLDQIKTSPGSLAPNSYLVLISKDGKDSAQAAKILIENWGFSQRSTFSLSGGLDAWIAKGYSVEK